MGIDSNGMIPSASGLTPMMKKLEVVSTGSKSEDEKAKADHPIPRLETKKSKSKPEVSEQKKSEQVDRKSTPSTPTKPVTPKSAAAKKASSKPETPMKTLSKDSKAG